MNRVDWWHVFTLIMGLVSAVFVSIGLWLTCLYVITAFR